MRERLMYFSDVKTTRKGFTKRSDALGDELEHLLRGLVNKLRMGTYRQREIVSYLAVNEEWFDDFKARVREVEAKCHEVWKARHEELEELKARNRSHQEE